MARVDRLRVWLVAATVVLLLVLLGAMSYSRYKAGKSWLNGLKKRSGVSLIQETDGFTYSQSSGGKTIFTLHAAKAFQHSQGLVTLHDVVLTVYESGGRADKIYGNEFEWDKDKGIARAMGETLMDLQMQPPKTDGSAPADNVLHVKTSGLVFLRNLGVGATPEMVEFEYAGLKCTAKGAEFDKSPGELHLLADVHADGEWNGEPVSLRAARADLARDSGMVSFVQPVVSSGARHGQAESAVVHVREHGGVDHLQALGAVQMDEGTRRVTADRVEARFGADNRVEAAHLAGGVTLADADRLRPLNGTAADVQLRFDGAGRLASSLASGGAQLTSTQTGLGGAPLVREMRGQTIDAVMTPKDAKSSRLKTLHVVGGASVRGESQSAVAGGRELRTSRVAADDLTASFVAESGNDAGVRPDVVHGRGHTELRQTTSGGAERVSSGDALDATFAAGSGADPARLEVASATQDGHVVFRTKTPAKAVAVGAKTKPDDVASGSADHAAYDGSSDLLTLTGSAHVVEAATSVTAASVVVHQDSGDAEARGNVMATLAGEVANGMARPATHVSAAHAVLHHAADTAEFDAGDGKPARMWQEASQVEASRIALDGKTHTLVATPSVVGVVRSVFAGAPSAAKPGAAKSAEPRILRVESRELQYSDTSHEAVFAGPVVISGTGGEVRAKKAVAFFAPAAAKIAGGTSTLGGLPAGSLERVVATGDVHIAEPGRQGYGEQLTYTSADGSALLTGTPGAPPRVTDAQQGMVTGASLLLRPGESTIVVTGAAAGDAPVAAKPARARVETKVKQGTK